MSKVTDIKRDTEHVNPTLLRKVHAVLADVGGQLPAGWTVAIFETERTIERARWLRANGYSKTTRSKHVRQFNASGMVEGVDVAFKLRGKWNWKDVPRGFWDKVHSAKLAHELRSMRFASGFVDDPHCELEAEG